MLKHQFDISASTAATVVLATVVMYLAFVALVALAGRSVLSARTPVELGCVAAAGAVVGRTSLLTAPTVSQGLIALVVLFAAQRTLRLLRRIPVIDRAINDRPVVLVRDGIVDELVSRRCRVSADDLRQAVRQAGHRRLSQVGLVVLERNGSLSVMCAADNFDPWLLDDMQPEQADRQAR